MEFKKLLLVMVAAKVLIVVVYMFLIDDWIIGSSYYWSLPSPDADNLISTEAELFDNNYSTNKTSNANYTISSLHYYATHPTKTTKTTAKQTTKNQGTSSKLTIKSTVNTSMKSSITSNKSSATTTINNNWKKILLWNSPERIEAAAFGTGHQVFVDAKCPISDCFLTAQINNKSDYLLLETFDAVLINVHELWLSMLLPDTYRRPQHQRLVFFTQETPINSPNLDVTKLDNVFNWTMTYQHDSDVRLLYGRVRPNEQQPLNITSSQQVQQNIRNNKTGKVAWMVSHCPTFSHREDYVAQLSKFIPVDIYGNCGKLKCPRDENNWLSDPGCYVHLAARYKFYLSFENSICTDYVTEKFFNILNYDIVPVVMGGANYSAIAPPHSFIDALQFDGPKELADYLMKLDREDGLYGEYFKWKNSFTVEAGVEQMARHAFCDLCAKLHKSDVENKEEQRKFYSSLVPFFGREARCKGTWNEYLKRI
jgi:alpha-1,3-fucosyltransferase